jgi:hypothetical protein
MRTGEETIAYDVQRYDADMRETVKETVNEIITALLKVRKQGCLIQVQIMAKAVSKHLGIVQGRKLNRCIEEVLELDERIESWGFGRARGWNVKKQEKYATRAAHIFQLRGE